MLEGWDVLCLRGCSLRSYPRLLSGDAFSVLLIGSRESYHLTVNTTDWQIKELAPVVAEYARKFFERTAP